MKRRRFLGTTLGASTALAHAAAKSQDSPPGNLRIFLLAGQSNMAGRGKIAPADREPHPRVWSFAADSEWQPATAPLHFDKPKIAGVGPGRAFGIALAEQYPDRPVGLVPCAVGGSPLKSWEPGAEYEALGVHPYDDAIRRTQAALANGTLSGILWHQGESDAGNPEDAATYADRLADLIQRFRADLDAPGLPFLVGELGRFPDRAWTDPENPVNRAHREVAKTVPNCAWVSAEDLTPMSDGTHFDAKSARELGRRYAEVWVEKFGA
ncbi:MAG: sialate O-acetylesterase [Verrucomicrobiales bacterium]